MKTSFTKIFSILILSSIFSLSALVLVGSTLGKPASAAEQPISSFGREYKPLAPLPYTTTTPGGKTNFLLYLTGGFKLAIAGSAVLAVIMITIGGFQYMTSIAEGTKTEAKDRIWNAIIGLCLALGSFLFLNTINPQLTKLDQFKINKPGTVGGGENLGSIGGTGATDAETLRNNSEMDKLLSEQEALWKAMADGTISPENARIAGSILDGKILQQSAFSTMHIILVEEATPFLKQNATGEDLRKASDLALKIRAEGGTRADELYDKGYIEEALAVSQKSRSESKILLQKIAYRERCPTDYRVIARGGAYGAAAQITEPCI